jgi:hypothetical protein
MFVPNFEMMNGFASLYPSICVFFTGDLAASDRTQFPRRKVEEAVSPPHLSMARGNPLFSKLVYHDSNPASPRYVRIMSFFQLTIVSVFGCFSHSRFEDLFHSDRFFQRTINNLDRCLWLELVSGICVWTGQRPNNHKRNSV